MLDESPTANLENDHEFIIKEYYLHSYEAFWGSRKQSHENLCSKWTISYHCRELCSSNMTLSFLFLYFSFDNFKIFNFVSVKVKLDGGSQKD